MRKPCLKIYLLFLPTIICFGETINVPTNYIKIQDAIDASKNGDTVLVDDGTYIENINFKGKNIVVASNYAIDQNTDHILNTIIDGSKGIPGESGSCVEFKNGEDSTAVIQGFTITSGSASITQSFIEGGGIVLEGSSATIKNNLFIKNEATNGGGAISVFGATSNPRIYNNIITQNRGGQYGGGIVTNWTRAVIRNNIIFNNEAGSVYGGGGILIWGVDSLPVIIENNTIVGNQSGSFAGGFAVYVAGTPVIRNNIIWGNQQITGGQNRLMPSAIYEYNNTQGFNEGLGNISDTPDFLDTLFRLSNLSPCIDAGFDNPNYNDKDNSRNDMGAYGGPYVGDFPDFEQGSIIISSSLLFVMKQNDTLSREIIIINSGTKELTVDSIVFPSTLTDINPDGKISSLVMKPGQTDSIVVSVIARQETTVSDSVYIYHNLSTTQNPKTQFVYYTVNVSNDEITKNMRARWKFNEENGSTIFDEAGFSDGTSNDESITRISGVDGKALKFDPNSPGAKVEIPHTDSLDFKSDESFSVSMLIKNDPVNYTNEVYLLIKGTTGGIGKWYAISNKFGQLRFIVDDNIIKTQLVYTLPEDYDVDVWHHVVGVRDRETTRLYLYLDGELVASTDDNTNETLESGLPLLLSNYNPNENTAIDDVIIYNKALTSLDVLKLYSFYDIPPLSSDASVTDLNINNFEFIEGEFDPIIKNYTVQVPFDQISVTINCITNNSFAKISGDGIFTDIPGTDTITIISQDLSKVNIYIITINQLPSSLNNGLTKEIQIIPNPADNFFIVNVDEKFIGSKIDIMEITGKLVYSATIKETLIKLDISGLNGGTYVLKINNIVNKVVIR